MAFSCSQADFLRRLSKLKKSHEPSDRPGAVLVVLNCYDMLDWANVDVIIRAVDEVIFEGATIHVQLILDEKTVEFDIYWTDWETYEDVFRTVGFRSWKLEPFLIPPEVVRKCEREFWNDYLAAPSVIHFSCWK